MYPVVADDYGRLFEWNPISMIDVKMMPDTCRPGYHEYGTYHKNLFLRTPEMRLSRLTADGTKFHLARASDSEKSFVEATKTGKNASNTKILEGLVNNYVAQIQAMNELLMKGMARTREMLAVDPNFVPFVGLPEET